MKAGLQMIVAFFGDRFVGIEGGLGTCNPTDEEV
jgi:hypothetical protein